MRALVTGAAGFLGSHLVDALVARGCEVVALDNLSRGRLELIERHLAEKAVEFHCCDVRDLQSLATALRGVDIVYHLAAQSNVMGALSDPDYSFSTNVTGTYNVLTAAAEAKVRRVVFSSSREVYGEAGIPVREDSPLCPKNAYGASKAAGEAYCSAWQRTMGCECVILRFGNVYGLRDRDRVIPLWLEQALRGEDLLLYGGTQVLDFVPVDLAVAALLTASDCPSSEVINVASGQGVRLEALARSILRLTGSSSRLLRVEPRAPEVGAFVADVGRMVHLLGLTPPQDPLAGLSALVEGFRSGCGQPV